jgi:hypothetical protein
MDGSINFSGSLAGSIADSGGGKIQDVQTNASGEYTSVVDEQGVAKIDLSNYATDEQLESAVDSVNYAINNINSILSTKQNVVDYSTNEQFIGTWFGKPIYQKIIDWSSSPVNIPSTWSVTTIDSSNIERVIDCKGHHADGTFYNTDADPTGNNHTNLKLKDNGGGGTYSYVTLRYTKIND